MSQRETLFANKKIDVSVMFDTVSISIHCGDAYEAQVLFDDLTERLQRGEGLVLNVGPGTGKSQDR